MTCKQIRDSKVSDKRIIMVCTIPEKWPLRTPKASDKREVPSNFDPERRMPPPDPLEMDHHPELMSILRDVSDVVESYVFHEALRIWEKYSADYQRPDPDDIYEDAMIDILNDRCGLADLADKVSHVDKNITPSMSWNLLMLAKKHAIADEGDLVGCFTLGERELKFELLTAVFKAWYNQSWDGREKWEREEKRRSEQDHA